MFKIIKKEDEEIAYLDPKKRKELIKKKYDYFLNQSGIPRFYWDINFKDYKGENSKENVEKLIYYSEHFNEDKFKFVHLYLYGSNNSQKCLIGNSLILTDKGFKYINKFDNNCSGFIEKKVKLFTKDDIQESSHFYKNKSNTIYIETELGFNLEGTPEHPIYIYTKNCDFTFKKLKDLNKDDVVVIYKNSNIFNLEFFEIDFNYKKHKNDSCSKDIIIPKILNKNLARFLGYYIANGNNGHNNITISTKNKNIIEDIKYIIKEFNINLNSQDELIHKIFSIKFNSFILYILGINKNEKFTARYKFVPDCILQSPKEIQIEFLKGLIDCDSYINKNKSLGYFTASKKLAYTVQIILLNLGITSKIYKTYKKKYDHVYYELWINGKDVNNYFNLITYSLKYNNIKNKKNSCYNSIPFLLQKTKYKLKIFRKLLKVDKSGRFLFNNKKYIFTLGKFKNFGTEKTNLSRDKYLEILNELKSFLKFDKNCIIKNLINDYENIKDNYIFSNIKKIKYFNNKKDVYDFTIPKYHNFYSNGFISHNTALACNVGKKIIKQGYKVKFLLASVLIDKLMKLQGFGYNREIDNEIKDIKKCDIIIIDDIFDQTKSILWSKPESSSLIITAWDSFLRELVSSSTKLILTSNIPVNMIEKKFGISLFNLIDRNFICLGFFDDVKIHRKKSFDNLFPK